MSGPGRPPSVVADEAAQAFFRLVANACPPGGAAGLPRVLAALADPRWTVGVIDQRSACLGWCSRGVLALRQDLVQHQTAKLWFAARHELEHLWQYLTVFARIPPPNFGLGVFEVEWAASRAARACLLGAAALLPTRLLARRFRCRGWLLLLSLFTAFTPNPAAAFLAVFLLWFAAFFVSWRLSRRLLRDVTFPW